MHRFEVLPEGELVVLSFHTVAEEDLLEVSAAGERTYTDPAEPSRPFSAVRGPGAGSHGLRSRGVRIALGYLGTVQNAISVRARSV